VVRGSQTRDLLPGTRKQANLGCQKVRRPLSVCNAMALLGRLKQIGNEPGLTRRVRANVSLLLMCSSHGTLHAAPAISRKCEKKLAASGHLAKESNQVTPS
jgi:hypothetical protein